MRANDKVIEHLGRVDAITRNDIRVTIVSQSACATCHAKGACTAADVEEKVVAITKPNHNFMVGETVKVVMKQSQGFKALMLGYIYPLILVLVALFTLSAMGLSDEKSGLITLALLVPYYGIVYLFRNKISKKFNFQIEKLN